MGTIQQFSLSSLPVPTPAADWGYTRRTMHDHFEDTSGIDMANSQVNGFKWYLRNDWPNAKVGTNTGVDHGEQFTLAPTVDTANISIAGSVLTLDRTFPATKHLEQLCSACYSDTDPRGYVGQVVDTSKGFFIETRVRFNPASVTSAAVNNDPGVWGIGIDFVLGNQFRYVEVGINDIFPSGVGNHSFYQTLHDWDFSTNPPTHAVVSDGASPGTDQATDTWYTCAMLHVPKSFNGGTGIVRRWRNGVLTGTEINYTGTTHGTFGLLDDRPFYLMIAGAGGAIFKHDYVSVWQRP